MTAIRHIERVTGKTLVLDLPDSLQGKRIEITVRELPDEKPLDKTVFPRRQPPAALFGHMRVNDDLLVSPADEADWKNS